MVFRLRVRCDYHSFSFYSISWAALGILFTIWSKILRTGWILLWYQLELRVSPKSRDFALLWRRTHFFPARDRRVNTSAQPLQVPHHHRLCKLILTNIITMAGEEENSTYEDDGMGGPGAPAPLTQLEVRCRHPTRY
jgi:hypothetical protein